MQASFFLMCVDLYSRKDAVVTVPLQVNKWKSDLEWSHHWGDSDAGDIVMLVIKSYWQNFDDDDIVWMLVLDA